MIGKAFVLVLLVVILGPPIRTIWNLGWGLHFHKQHPGTCRTIKRPGVGSEDFQILSNGLTFITAGLKMGLAPPAASKHVESKCKGSIQMMDLSQPGHEAKQVTIKHGKDFNPATFRPHGLSVLEDKVKGEHLVYVINHAEEQEDRVEKFKYSPKTKELRHVKSIFSDVFRVTNDLAVVSEDKFYISNWMYFNTPLGNIVETFYNLPLGAILFYNGSGFTAIKSGMHSPNSVMMSKNNKFVYVSLPTNKVVQVYQRTAESDLRLVQEIVIHTGLDNFHLSETGDALYGGCHPIAHKAVGHFTDPAQTIAPSQVLRLPLKDGLIVEEEITQEFYDHGDLISGSSIAGVYKNKLLIGSVIEKLVMCDLPTQR